MPRFVRRRPLMRAAVVGGGAYAVGKRSARKEDQVNAGIADAQAQAQQAAQAAAPEAAEKASSGISEDDLAKLKQLADLHDSGALTDAEFDQAKKKILGS
jgi:membrane protease subunit (stomatin/prohibitin family)